MAIRWKTTDSHDAIRYTALDAHKQPVNLIGATARFLMGKQGDADSVIINEPAQVADEMAGKLAYELTEIATLEAGTFNAEFHVEWPDGSRKVFPSEGYLAVTVAPSLDMNKVGEVEERIVMRVSQIEEFKDEIVAEVDGFRATVGQAEDAAVEAEVQADYAKTQGDYAKVEADRVAGMDVSKLTAQLAEKATKEEVRLKTEKAEPEDLSERTLALVTGQGTINLLSIPQPGSVTPETLSEPIKKITFLMKNIVTNGDFSSGRTGWKQANVASALYESEVRFTVSGQRGKIQNDCNMVNGHKYYVSGDVVSDSNLVYLAVAGLSATMVYHPGNNSKQKLSRVFTWSAATGIFPVEVVDFRTAGFTEITGDNFLLVNLTETFGVGKEPTKEKFEELISNHPNSWFNGSVSLWDSREMYNKIEALAQYKENPNEKLQVSTLPGTIQSIQFNPNKSVKSVQYKTGSTLIREDLFTYEKDKITEKRRLSTGETLTLIHNLKTFETEVE